MVAVTWMVFMGTVFLFPATPEVRVEDMNYAVVVLGGVFTLLLAYYYFPKYGGKNWFTGPVQTVGVPGCVPDVGGDQDKESPTAEVIPTRE